RRLTAGIGKAEDRAYANPDPRSERGERSSIPAVSRRRTLPEASAASRLRRGARVVDWDGLENRWAAPPSRGFESHPLRWPVEVAPQPPRAAGSHACIVGVVLERRPAIW